MPFDVTRLVERLVQEGDRTHAFFSKLRGGDWSKEVYSEGATWTAKQVLAHFVAAEKGVTRLIVNILEGGSGAPEDFSLDEYNQRKVRELDIKTPDELLEEFSRARRDTVQIVQDLTSPDLERMGRHPFLGVTRLVDIIKMMYRHNQIHQRDLRRVLDLDSR